MSDIISFGPEIHSDKEDINNKYKQCISLFDKLNIKKKSPYDLKKNVSVLVYKKENNNGSITCNAYFIVSDGHHNQGDITKLLNKGEEYFLDNYKILYKDDEVSQMLNIDLDTMKVICYIFSFKYAASYFSFSSINNLYSDFSRSHPMFWGSSNISDAPVIIIYLQNGIISKDDDIRYTLLKERIQEVPISVAAKDKAYGISAKTYCDMCFDGTINDFSFHKLNKECQNEFDKRNNSKPLVKNLFKKKEHNNGVNKKG